MLHFPQFEALGLSVAAITNADDGDCGLANKTGAEHAEALGNRRAACQACGANPALLSCAQQTHSPNMACVTEANRGRGAADWATGIPDTDGLITACAGIPLAIFVADCVPVYLFCPGAGAIGLVHAGREGTRARIAARAVEGLIAVARETAPNASAAGIHALIGPSAGPCCYQVSPEMATEWGQAGLPVQGRNLDLWEANRAQLAEAGVPEAHITTAGVCTICDARFYSYRRQHTPARNMALLMI